MCAIVVRCGQSLIGFMEGMRVDVGLGWLKRGPGRHWEVLGGVGRRNGIHKEGWLVVERGRGKGKRQWNQSWMMTWAC
jgi:hypothetical protein